MDLEQAMAQGDRLNADLPPLSGVFTTPQQVAAAWHEALGPDLLAQLNVIGVLDQIRYERLAGEDRWTLLGEMDLPVDDRWLYTVVLLIQDANSKALTLQLHVNDQLEGYVTNLWADAAYYQANGDAVKMLLSSAAAAMRAQLAVVSTLRPKSSDRATVPPDLPHTE